MICQTIANACNCPTTSAVSMCDCASTNYYDSVSKACGNLIVSYCSNEKLLKLLKITLIPVARFTSGVSCSYTYQCRTDLLLSCTSGTCQYVYI